MQKLATMNYEKLEFGQLCHLAGIDVTDAERHGITRSEIISILKQSKI